MQNSNSLQKLTPLKESCMTLEINCAREEEHKDLKNILLIKFSEYYSIQFLLMFHKFTIKY